MGATEGMCAVCSQLMEHSVSNAKEETKRQHVPFRRSCHFGGSNMVWEVICGHERTPVVFH